jgi:ribose-phosphate pyrophosphokinase
VPDLMLFSGNSVPRLAESIANHLGLKLAKADVGTFSDGETRVEILENVRGRDVFVIQSTCPPTNNNLMELVVMVDALRRASAGRITAVMPYFGYGRQDRRARSARVPITARVVADMLAACGVDRIVTVDIHAEQIQGFFNIPVDNVYGMPILYDFWKTNHSTENLVIVSPDIGGVVRARAMAKKMHCDLAIIDKRRPKENESVVMNIIGEVQGRHCVVVDDIVDTAGTLCKGAEALIAQGALTVSACCLHPVLSGKAIHNIENSPLSHLIVTDSIPLSPEARACGRIRQISIAYMLSETIRRINTEESISMMFQEEIEL